MKTGKSNRSGSAKRVKKLEKAEQAKTLQAEQAKILQCESDEAGKSMQTVARNRSGCAKRTKKLEKAEQAKMLQAEQAKMLQCESDEASWHNFRPKLFQLLQHHIGGVKRELKKRQVWPVAETIQWGNLIVHSFERAWCEFVGRPIHHQDSVGSVLPGKMALMMPQLIDAGADSMSLNGMLVAEEMLLTELENGLLRLQGKPLPSDKSRPRTLSDVPRGERVQGVVVGVIEFPAKNSRGKPRTAFGKMIIEVQLEKHGPTYSLPAICRHKQDAFGTGQHVGLALAWERDRDFYGWNAVAKEVFPVAERFMS